MRILLSILTSLFFGSEVFAQHVISGRITNASTGEPLEGAHVRISGVEQPTFTDKLGKYAFNELPEGQYVLTLTFVGFVSATDTVRIAGADVIANVKLKPGELVLADVQVEASPDAVFKTLSQVDIRVRPIGTSQDVLRIIPGLFIAQHAGGGKAEQIFLRGFDIDHGTDINLSVDGMPVNMVSHAHGQGYSDLHFLIPEFIQQVDFSKGPYDIEKGDFATAGYVAFSTPNRLESNFLKLEGGQFGTFRGVGGANLLGNALENHASLYVGGEYSYSDGYFESSQNFNRINLMAKSVIPVSDEGYLTVIANYFDSKWNASGQIPDRAVEDGSISRFGSIDNTEGGSTGRINASLKHTQMLSGRTYLEQQAYASKYTFDLFSNFTFYLNDPVNGDQIEQSEDRWIYGYNGFVNINGWIAGKQLTTRAGAGFRYDDVDGIALAHTVKRSFLGYKQLGDVDELNVNGFVEEQLPLDQHWTITAGLRYDYFTFRYRDKLAAADNKNSGAMLSPKATIHYNLNPSVRFYLQYGTGFHSNDARVASQQAETLPRAQGIDLGSSWKLGQHILMHAALWRLDLEQEFVYVGDEGIVEPSGRTKREGVDLSVRWQVVPWLYADVDVNWTNPRSKDDPEGENYIPLAPIWSSVGGLTWQSKSGITGSLRYRYLADRPANETNTVIASGYFVNDLMMSYKTGRHLELGISVQNTFNVEWNEAQFDTESRLYNESQPVSEIHFTPGTPRMVKLQATFVF